MHSIGPSNRLFSVRQQRQHFLRLCVAATKFCWETGNAHTVPKYIYIHEKSLVKIFFLLVEPSERESIITMMMACTGQKRLRSDRIHCYTGMDESGYQHLIKLFSQAEMMMDATCVLVYCLVPRPFYTRTYAPA